MNEQDKKIVLTLAECNMNIARASRVLYMHRNTVEYHLQKIESATELNPHSFYDLVQLVQNVRGDELV